MTKRLIILLSFLAYSLSLVHSIVPHHHHDNKITDHHHHDHSTDHDHDNHEEKTVGHAFADAIHFLGSDIVIQPQQSYVVQKTALVAELYTDNLAHFISPKLKPPDFNIDKRHRHYSSIPHYLFLLRAPPVA
jgi:hypothetical protein